MARGRRHSEKFKADAVVVVRESGRPIAQLAKELGVDDSTLSYWVRHSCTPIWPTGSGRCSGPTRAATARPG